MFQGSIEAKSKDIVNKSETKAKAEADLVEAKVVRTLRWKGPHKNRCFKMWRALFGGPKMAHPKCGKNVAFQARQANLQNCIL